jgi:protein O-GlcNAc transferase
MPAASPTSGSSAWTGGASQELGEVTREAYGLPERGIVMCNFNQLFKVDPLVFAAWMRLLTRVPNAYLWLLRLPSTAEEALRAEAATYGPGVSSRLLFSDRIAWKNHLIVKALANISLDNPVFNSHTSGVDILWAGVPLLTLAGIYLTRPACPCYPVSSSVAIILVASMFRRFDCGMVV